MKCVFASKSKSCNVVHLVNSMTMFKRTAIKGFFILNFFGFLLANSSKTEGPEIYNDLIYENSSCAASIFQLNEENKILQKELEFIVHESDELRFQIKSLLEQCDHIPQPCEHNGSVYSNEDRWHPDSCTTCRCENGISSCAASYHSSNCVLQCSDELCLNGGTCHLEQSSHSIQCQCPGAFSGPLCEQTTCLPIQIDGPCDAQQSVWYWDSYSNRCKPIESGCFDPKSTFLDYESCSLFCMKGTCCYRMTSENSSDMICQSVAMEDCQNLCRQPEVEVVGFYPGINCPEEGCALVATKTCHTGIAMHSPGSKFQFGCDSCECREDHISCDCQSYTVRREIREMVQVERIHYQKLLAKLQLGNERSVWNSMRNLYATHIMHANSPIYFLFWNRIFLRTMEKHLQEYDCSVFIPYLDLTLDAGNVSMSVIWKDDYFGHLTPNRTHCQRYTVPGENIAWTPCIRRNFTNSTVPNMIDVAMALAKSDFLEFSSDMRGISDSLHYFVGGDMDSESAPNDPLFYSLHAYIDMVFWMWQKRHSREDKSLYIDKVLHGILSPFNTEQRYLIDSENLCVAYKSISSDEHYQRPDCHKNIKERPQIPCISNGWEEPDVRETLNAGHRIQSILYNQQEPFLTNLPRTCNHVSRVNSNSINNAWNVDPVPLNTSTNVQISSEKISNWGRKFCFTADIFLPTKELSTENSCHSNQIPVCDASSLSNCPYYTYAPCKLLLCGNCSMICHVNNQDISCDESKQDYCSPNPCQNEGICQPSRWPSLPHLISCSCPPGFEGELCEKVSQQRCFLPQDEGKLLKDCGEPTKRWYFNLQTQDCHSFHYRGCLGNANNFLTYYECRVSCMIGACCWREPLYPDRIYGYNEEGYDRYGFRTDGTSHENEKRTFDNGYGGNQNIFRFSDYDYQGYNRQGYNKRGLDRFGYNSQGYHYQTRFNLTGYDAFGDHDGIIDFNEHGYNSDGYNRANLNCHGNNKDGWDYYGLASGWSFECRALNLQDCQNIEKEFPYLNRQVISFSPSKKCEEVSCEEKCGCNFLEKSIAFGAQFPLGCGMCVCNLSRRIACPCVTTSIRKEIRDMTREEMIRYQNAVKSLGIEIDDSAWYDLADLYRKSIPQSHGNVFFLPWHRFFLRYTEMKLQEIDCSVTIPYFDWTLDVGDLASSVVWQSNMFGGNGDDTDNYCVKRHPFKDFFSVNWSTCLRRKFNQSIHLPSAVDIERISRLNSFDEFSYHLERISGLFHLFVGGHMGNTNAAYDPILLSFYAFIDKIWFYWFMDNPPNVEKFPQEYRYIPMFPFGITPDDVLLSKSQLCVSYVQITDGAPCILDMNHYEANEHTFQRIFDIDGFDQDGYDKFGFDRSGWNRYGFNRDSFNRDGFDFSGYDRLGYNRYGFDRNGCNKQGYCIFHTDFNSNKRKSSWEDFNEIGLSSTGLDFHGNDIYGFNAKGFDKRNCSFFFKGPFYPVHMKNIGITLKELDNNDLKHIKNICPAVSPLPDWWLDMFWLNRISDLFNENMLFQSQIAEYFFSPLAHSEDVWLAPTPDERFCFPLHIHSKCELTQEPVPCPLQTCPSPYCSSEPSAKCREFGCGSCDRKFYDVVAQKPTTCDENGCLSNGIFRKDGENWMEDPCKTCVCEDSFVSCSSVHCDTSCDHPVIIPNMCCPVCDGCVKDDILFSNGADFIDPQNPCLKCNCRNGSILCSTVDCDAMKPCPQNALITPPGECCPKCSMCGPHFEGSYWLESPCHNCTCQDSSVHCSVIECPMPSCQYPARGIGECCRHCDDCEYNGSYIKDRQIFNPGNCQECLCQKGNIQCTDIDCDHPKCQNAIEPKEKCCVSCQKDCFYDGKNYKDGENFNPVFNPCLNCSCKRSLVRCQPATCPDTQASCGQPVFLPGKCCPECPSCVYRNQQYPNGARWRVSNDSCEVCRCFDGNVICTEKDACSDKQCTHGVLPKGSCCSPCTDCQYGDHIVPDQLQFSPPEDPCARCKCSQGNISCMREACPQVRCRETELPPGACCPRCKSCKSSNGQLVQHGQKWIHPDDMCQVCSCEEGISKCERMECHVPCSHPVLQRNKCCAECSDCLVSGRIYQNNKKIPTNDPCRKCFCYRGSMECESVRCPTLTCEFPETKKGECCPTCKTCQFQGDTFEDGEKFQPKSDLCYECICDRGVVQCHKKSTCNPQCSNPASLPSQCCPVCDACEYEGKVYRNGERFTPNPEEVCYQCQCENGNVECFLERCPKLSCSTTRTTPGRCCGECSGCVDNISGQTYDEGETWTPSNDPCKICNCKGSVSQCHELNCPVPDCLHAAAPFGVCCKECDHCEYTRRLYRNGQEFAHEEDPCQICKCVNGNVSCETVLCDPLPCTHPEELKGMCCPICAPDTRCHYQGKTYEAWENFLDPSQPCSECVCIDGMVSCHQVLCLNTECPNPQLGHCCESCDGCSYGETNFMNHVSFRDPSNPCRECKCNDGLVSCQPQSCGTSSCQDVDFSGQCCPMCEASNHCIYKNIMFANKEKFIDPEDPCIKCFCHDTEVFCHLLDCENDICDDALRSQCCQTCSDCIFLDISAQDGSIFSHPHNVCEMCSCEKGSVTCFPKPCPPVQCSHPVERNCCMVCEGCLFENRIYKELNEFPDPYNLCQQYYCQNGNILTEQKVCTPVTCKYPSIKGCCPECDDCLYKNEIIGNGQKVDHDGEDACQQCACRNGDVDCHPKSCPTVHCTNPVIKDCCPICHLDCLYKNEIIRNGQKVDFDDADACEDCVCLNSNIDCHPKSCPTAYCTNPIIKDCCPVCHLGCLYDNKIYQFGAEFIHPSDPCSECACMSGSVKCETTPCLEPSCLHPVLGNCCLECEKCNFSGKIYANGQNFKTQDESCMTCTCKYGSVTCEKEICPQVPCMHPALGECCPECKNCEYFGEMYIEGQSFKNPNDPCKTCLCKSGNVICEKKPCPRITCLHPAYGECCLECEKCKFFDEIYINGEKFTNPEDPCETCLCTKGQVACRRNPCIQCLHPMVSEFHCCPLCDGCTYKGNNYTNQEHFTDPENACEECICKNGTVTCHELSCSLPSCSKPVVRAGVCCPMCPGCEFAGSQFEENEEFAHPDNVCEKCICKDSHVVCKTQICHKNCSHPIPDPCCPICEGCMFETVKYSNEEIFHPDSCKTCECKDGNVICTSEQCPDLSCQLRVRLPGTCCETCRGCVYEGNEYENEETWFSATNPCLSCSCYGGTVTCKNTVCTIDCVEPVPVPGLCCPICPDCEKDNKRYKSGEVFSPDDHPCDSCTCDSGHIFCIRYECPTLIGCPEEAIKPPGEGECCPTCAAYGSLCTRDQIGKLFHPTGDPCFSCECSDNFMWVCSKEFCPSINCPVNEIITLQNECCPKCKVCINEDVHSHGDSWSPPNDACTNCSCNYGSIECKKIACPEVHCETNEMEFRVPGECCSICIDSRFLSCDYNGQHYEHGKTWNPDACTVCQCTAGKMRCTNERCLPLQCSSDEIQSVDPGQCCPKCIPRPATCIAFGDPHYRTFDGAAISFQGTCRYVLTADCSTQQFNILVENNNRGFDGVSWTHRVVVVLQNASVDLRSGPSVYVKGKQIHHLPYFDDPVLYVENTGSSVLVTTNVGVQVLWNGDGYVEVIVSGVYQDKTCGLCGNFNNFPEDDMRTPTNEIVHSEAEFGNSWKNPGIQPEGCSESIDIDPCSVGGYRIRKMANSKCSILKQSFFASCHRFIPPEPYFSACVYDVCACSQNDDCLCDILSAYSQECSKAGIIVHWRNEGLCGIKCSYEEGFVFDECGPPCPRTCANMNVPIGVLAAQCFKPCVPGCQCSADKVLHNGKCIRPNECPLLEDQEKFF